MLYIDMNQPWIYMYSPFQSSLPPPSPPEKPLISFERDSPSWTLFPSEVPKVNFPYSSHSELSAGYLAVCLAPPRASQTQDKIQRSSRGLEGLQGLPGSLSITVFQHFPSRLAGSGQTSLWFLLEQSKPASTWLLLHLLASFASHILTWLCHPECYHFFFWTLSKTPLFQVTFYSARMLYFSSKHWSYPEIILWICFLIFCLLH